jgi:hypothetical protein
MSKCKFCGCSEKRACLLVQVFPAPGLNPYLLPPGVANVPADAETSILPCEWLLPDVCTNPACVEKAYAEARTLALDLAVDSELAGVEFPPSELEWTVLDREMAP